MRSSLQLLHHSAVARQVPLAEVRVGGGRVRAAGALRSEGDHADRPGHDLLRRGFWFEGRPGAVTRKVSQDRRPALDTVSVRLPEQDYASLTGDHRRAWKDLPVCGCSPAARFGPDPEAD